MTSKTRLSILLVSTPVLAFVIVGGLMGQERSSGDRVFRHLRVFEDVVQLVMSNYVEDVKVDKAMEGALRGLADGLDPDSAYLDAQRSARRRCRRGAARRRGGHRADPAVLPPRHRRA